jgi:hypothetical protein
MRQSSSHKGPTAANVRRISPTIDYLVESALAPGHLSVSAKPAGD